MRRRHTWIGLAVWAITLVGNRGACVASVTRGDPLRGMPTNDFPAVGRLGAGTSGNDQACSAVAVLDGRYILTTRHCVTTTGTIQGPLRDPGDLWFQVNSEIYYGVELFADFGGDLALLRLDQTAPSAFNLWRTEYGSELGQVFRGVGFGDTDTNADGRWGPDGQGVKRMFTNTVDNIAPGSIPGQGMVLRYDFDLTSMEHTGDLEGLHGPGDSGGAVLVPDQTGGGWLLAGIMSSAGNPVDGSTGSMIQVSAYHDAILATVPEPGTAALLAGVLAAFFRRRRA